MEHQNRKALNRKRILAAYGRTVEKTGFSDVLISDLHGHLRGDVPLETLKNWLTEECRSERAVPSLGDWSLSSEEARTAAIEINGRPHLRIRIFTKGGRKMAEKDNIDDMTYEELKKHIETAEERLQKLEKEHAKKVLSEAKKKAASVGYTATFKKTKKTTPETSKRTVKYQNPENPEETWSGQGRRPPWLKGKLEAGANLEDFSVSAG